MKGRGTGTAVPESVVTSFRTRLSAITLAGVMLFTAAASVFASGQTPPCPTHHHECTQTTQLRGCCCIEQGDRSNEATQAGGKTQVAQPVDDGSLIVTSPYHTLPDLLRHALVLTTSPRSSPPDLVTLFGTFLI